MFPSVIKTCIQTLFIVFLSQIVNGQDRKISYSFNPGCNACTEENNTLVYTKAEGSHDTIHQIWDFTAGAPTVILTVAGVNSTLNITWDGTVPRKFVFSETPKYSFAIAVDKLYEYDDLKDMGFIDERSPRRAVPLRRVAWRLTHDVRTDDEVMILMRGQLHEKTRTGTIDVKLDLLPFKDYAVELPHLIHTANSTLMDVSLVNLTKSPDFNASRFALRVILASVDASNDTMHYAVRKSLDDEHTPGVFEIIEIKSPASFADGDGGFLQFRPVAYTTPQRGVTTSTIVRVSPFNRTRIPEGSTLETFYLRADNRKLLVQDMLVSFGETGDGYYEKHNFTAWSFTVGYGAPPIEGFSVFVIAIICCGLGAPVALAASGAAYALLRRRRAAPQRTRFVDDE
ncbi:hypothetical protein ABMA28_005543 [Loxostege sticticalis]|uniref:Lysosomal protein NCU-G1 n=1 Tax=Loxostege sticticalis TaxID=481309 RepID=A0ABD0SMQ1_LOXSC